MAVLKDVIDRLAAAKAAQVDAWQEAQGVKKVDYDELTAAVGSISRGTLDAELSNLSSSEGAEPSDEFKEYLLAAVKNTASTLAAVETIGYESFKESDIVYCPTKACGANVSSAFNSCTWLYVVEPLDLSNVTSMQNFMCKCGKLRSLTFTGGSFSKVSGAIDAFNGCSSLESITIPEGAFAVLTSAHRMFNGCRALKSITLPEGAFANLAQAYSLFASCQTLTSIILPEGSCSKILNGEAMFGSCTSLQEMAFPSGSMAAVTNAASMFSDCSSLTSVTIPDGAFAAVMAVYTMFSGCKLLTSVAFPSGSLSAATNCSSMFYGCVALESVTFPEGGFANATNMNSMFFNCSSLTSLTLPEGSCSKVYNMTNMLNGASKLSTFTFPEGGMAGCLYVYGLIANTTITSLTNLDLSGLALTQSQLISSGIALQNQGDAYFVREMHITTGTHTALTSCPLSGTLYKSGVKLTLLPNLDGASLLSWVNALYDWAKNPEDKTTDDTSHTLYMSDDQQSTLLSCEGGEDAYIAATDKGWDFS